MKFHSNLHIYGNYGPGLNFSSGVLLKFSINDPGPKWNLLKFSIMVLVLVLSGKWTSAQNCIYCSGPK